MKLLEQLILQMAFNDSRIPMINQEYLVQRSNLSLMYQVTIVTLYKFSNKLKKFQTNDANWVQVENRSPLPPLLHRSILVLTFCFTFC